MDVVKVDSINTVKAIILVNSDFCNDFDKSVTLYKEFLNQSYSTQIESDSAQIESYSI